MPTSLEIETEKEAEEWEHSATHQFFKVSILLKAFNGVVEVLLGVSVFFITKTELLDLASFFARMELTEDPGDVLTHYLVHVLAQYTTTNQIFISVYLLIHGSVKIWLVYCLLKGYLWAYPTAMMIFGLFGTYQIYTYIQHPHLSLLALTFLDVLVILFTYLEYRKLMRTR